MNIEQNRQEPPRAERLEGFVIRAATSSDAEAVAALANLPGYRYGTLRLPFQTVAETRGFLEAPAAGSKNLVADLDGLVVGNIGLSPMLGRRRNAASIGMGVRDEFAGRGVGSALMAAVLDIADNWLALRGVELTVFADNEAAIGLYQRFGFVTEGLFKDFAFRDGRYVDAYAMARLNT